MPMIKHIIFTLRLQSALYAGMGEKAREGWSECLGHISKLWCGLLGLSVMNEGGGQELRDGPGAAPAWASRAG